MEVTTEEILFSGYNKNPLKGKFFFPQSWEEGKRIGIVLFHGLFSSSQDFTDFPLRLATQGIAVFSFNYSGQIHNKNEPFLLTKESAFSDIEAALGQLRKKGVSVIGALGHSFGCYLSLKAAEMDPSIRFLILCAPQIESGGSLHYGKRVLLNILGKAYQIFGRYIPDCYLNYPLKISGKNEKIKVNLRLSQFLSQANNYMLAKRIFIPVLIIAGKKDKDIRPETIKYLADAFQGKKKFILFDESGHDFFREKISEQLIQEINLFVKENPCGFSLTPKSEATSG